jgi:hypothetical protein
MNRFWAKALRAGCCLGIATIVGCTVSPTRYAVRDASGINCFNLGDYAVAQSMQDMMFVVSAVYQGRASEQTLEYMTSTIRESTIGYCIRATGSVRPEDAVAYGLSRAKSIALKSVDVNGVVVSTRRSAELVTMVYVTVYRNSLATMNAGSR